MGADFSRVRLDPLLDYAGVELQQGRVLLDADANELMAILDRRLRALASDTLGRARVSSTTPDAFKIDTVLATLSIGKGRMYVDGLLAENHGARDATKQMFDPLLAEIQFSNSVAYPLQPYLPAPPALPTKGKHLVYLDVWDREVTPLEQPNLVENAVGVDASTRVQTVWQVRVLADDSGNFTCGSPDTDLPAWAALIAPSTGVLTTGAYDVAASDNPCELPPSGGYRGLENQLYRVEIHDPGQPGKATFKWSRENASVGSRATLLSPRKLELATLARDDVLRFNTGDWVEILDDAREFSQHAGEMRKITVDDATSQIRFDTDLPLEMQTGKNLRVRRWDQKGRVFRTGPGGVPAQVQDLDPPDSTGVIQVPAAPNTALLLEDGLTVTFATNGTPGFKTGDYWVFAARTGDASVEPLVKAPPRGIHHHYARLGIWDADAGTVSDCRPLWPPGATGTDCGCTVCVSPESHATGLLTIQDAVNKVRDTGGTVCLRAGQYALREPVRIANAVSVRVHGQGPATVISAPGRAFVVERSAAVRIDELTVLSLGTQSGFDVRNVIGLALRNLVVWVFGSNDARGAGIALSGIVAGATISDNFVIAPDGVRALSDDNDAPNFLFTAALHVEDNMLWCQHNGIVLDGMVGHLYEMRLARNQLLGCSTQGLSATGVALPGASVRFEANSFDVNGPGIRCGVGNAWIENNKLAAAGNRRASDAAVALVAGLDKAGPRQCHVLANQANGFAAAGIVIDAPVHALVVKLNIIEQCGNGIVMTGDGAAESLVIENNTLLDIGGAPGTGLLATFTAGISAMRTQSATISGNTLRRIGVQQQGQAFAAGILGVGVIRSRIFGNELLDIGPAGGVGAVGGIMLRAPYMGAELAHNHVEAGVQILGAGSLAVCHAVLIDEPTDNKTSRIARFAALRIDDGRMLVLDGERAYIFRTGIGPNMPAAIAVERPNATLIGNVLTARGRSPVAEVMAGGETLFSDNRCEQPTNEAVSAVILTTSVAVINANRVRNRGDGPSIRVVGPNSIVAAVANITSNIIEANLSPQFIPLNLVVGA
jgi:hypothetical protein